MNKYSLHITMMVGMGRTATFTSVTGDDPSGGERLYLGVSTCYTPVDSGISFYFNQLFILFYLTSGLSCMKEQSLL